MVPAKPTYGGSITETLRLRGPWAQTLRTESFQSQSCRKHALRRRRRSLSGEAWTFLLSSHLGYRSEGP